MGAAYGTDAGCTKRSKKYICQEHLVETNQFFSTRAKGVFTIWQKLSCDTSNIVYLLFCDILDHTQYLGERKITLKTRFYEHRSNINKDTGTLVTNHLNQKDNSLKNLKCMPIERVFGQTLGARLRRETFWMNNLRTVYPLGLTTLR